MATTTPIASQTTLGGVMVSAGSDLEVDSNGNASTAYKDNLKFDGTKAAIGKGATASAENSVALGTNSQATDADTVSVGTPQKLRRIMNAATAQLDSDVPNWGQVKNEVGHGGGNSGLTAGIPPTAKVGVTPVPGSDNNKYMPADAAPALDESLEPQWSGRHTFKKGFLLTKSEGSTKNFSMEVGPEETGIDLYCQGTWYASIATTISADKDLATKKYVDDQVKQAGNGHGGLTAGIPPTAKVGVAAVPGSNNNRYMPADAAPALDLTVTPQWSGTHTFQNGVHLTQSGGSTTPVSMEVDPQADGVSLYYKGAKYARIAPEISSNEVLTTKKYVDDALGPLSVTDSASSDPHAGATATKVDAIALGRNATTQSEASVSIGSGATIDGSSDRSVALGYHANVLGSRWATAIGFAANVQSSSPSSVALGYASVATEPDTVSVGTGAISGTEGAVPTRRIVNVKDGTGINDAATWGQVTKLVGHSKNEVLDQVMDLQRKLHELHSRHNALQVQYLGFLNKLEGLEGK